jgi:hypothetical protein
MINPNDYLHRVENEVIRTKAVSRPTCLLFADLPLEIRRAYAEAMRFLGCESVESSSRDTGIVPEAERIRAANLMLLKLGADSNDPRWSSWVLDRLLEAVMGTPGGSVGDLLHALHGLLGEYSCDLTEPVKNLIMALVVQCFTQHRVSYDASDLGWMVEKTVKGSTPAQAYLALHAIPPSIMRPRCAVAILKALTPTPYWKEAVNVLGDDLNNQEARALLAEWLAEGVQSSCVEEVQRLLG